MIEHLEKTNVRGTEALIGPTGTRTLSPSAPPSTGHGVYDTTLKASSPFLSFSGATPSPASNTAPVSGSSNTCHSRSQSCANHASFTSSLFDVGLWGRMPTILDGSIALCGLSLPCNGDMHVPLAIHRDWQMSANERRWKGLPACPQASAILEA